MSFPAGPHKRTAEKLGVAYASIELTGADVARSWSFADVSGMTPEAAVLAHFKAAGWNGVNAEGGLVLSLIKATAALELNDFAADQFVEGVFQAADAAGRADLVGNILTADVARISQNFDMMTRIARTPEGEPSCTWFPMVTKTHAIEFFNAIGGRRLHDIAAVFAREPYNYRAGWPDLTLWREDCVAFWEVKAPGDALHKSQKRLIGDVLVPLGLDAGVIDILRAPEQMQEPTASGFDGP